MKTLLLYLRNLVLWFFDIGFNVVFLAGSPYETISSRIQKRVEKGDRWAIVAACLIGHLFRDPDHCKNARVPDAIVTNLPNWWRKL